MALHFSQASETILADNSFEQILDDKSEFEYFLVQNKQLGKLYLKSLKNFDFLLIVKTIDEETIDTGSFYEQLKNIKDVQLALEIHYLTSTEQKRIEKDF